MGRAAQAVIAAALLGCGARTDLGKTEHETKDATPDAPADVTCLSPPFPACDAGPAPFDACAPIHYSTSLEETCALVRSQCTPIDAVGTAPMTCPTAGSDPCLSQAPSTVDVLALNRYGKGHIAAVCDVTGLTGLLQDLPLVAYLGGSKSAKVASLGTFPCTAATIGTYLGGALPAKYVGAASKLADDFDVLVLCASPDNFADHSTYGPLDIAWAPTFVSFVRDFGKGVLVGADYARNCASPSDVFAPLDAITQGAGITFAVTDFGYSPLTIDSACVPDWPK